LLAQGMVVGTVQLEQDRFEAAGGQGLAGRFVGRNDQYTQLPRFEPRRPQPGELECGAHRFQNSCASLRV
jgi:hypothetical protein